MRLLIAAVLTIGCLQAQPSAAPPPPVSPEVHSDGRVTFRYRAPNAKEVLLAREGAKRIPMVLGEAGVWTVTTEPLPPDMYGYSFVVDGVGVIDPVNPSMKPNLLNTTSMVHVPGKDLPWEIAEAPRGTLHHHFYKSNVVGDHRDYYVYTPPGYAATANRKYPVLYLLHGYSDDASGWTAVGRAHVIMDNLIARKKAEPMIVVMTLGYGAPEIVTRNWSGIRTPEIRERNMAKYRDALFAEVIPQVEKDYRALTDRANRAIAGLSMGGATSLFVGLNALERFSYVAAFSSGGLSDDLAAMFPKIGETANSQLKMLWISCGTEDGLIGANRKLVEFLKSRGVNAELKEHAGAHTWMVWRRNLADVAPLLFRK